MTLRIARPTAILLAAAIGCAGAIEVQANLAARAELRVLLEQAGGVGVFAEPFTGRVKLYGLHLGRGPTRVTIARLDLPLHRAGFGLVDEALAQAAPAGTAFAENVTITTGRVTYRIKRIDMTGTPLSNGDLAALVDPASPEPIATRLKKLNATAIVVPEILADDATAGSERHATLSQVVLSGVKAGRVDSGSAGRIGFAVKDGEEEMNGHVGAVQASAVDLAQIARVLGAVRSDAAEPLRPLYDSVTATDLELRNATRSSVVTLTSVKASGAKARPLATDYLTASKAQRDALPDAQRSAAYEDATRSFEIGGLEATDLAVRAGDDGNALTLASLTMRDLAKGRAGSIAFRAIAFEAPKVKLGIGAIDLGAFVLPHPADVATGAFTTNAMLPTTAKADLRALAVDVTAQDKDADGPTHAKFTVAHSAFAADGDPNAIPRSARITVDNLAFDLPPDAGKTQPLVEMGYHHLDLSGVLATTYASATRDLEIRPLSVSGTGMGSLGLGLKLANVTNGLIASNQTVAKAAAFSVLAKGLSLDLVNDGLIDRAIAWKAKQDGLDVGKEKAFLVDFFADKLPASLGDSANLKIIGAAVAKFVTEPKTLHVSIASQSGLGVGSLALLADPGLLIDTLEVKASAND